MAARVTVLGIGIDALTMEGAIREFERRIAEARPALACNVNVDICMRAQRDEELRAILRAADVILVDGTPMVWAARVLGSPLPGRVSGSDFVPAFCRVAAREGYGVFLLGGAAGVAEGARGFLERRNPGLRIVGTYAPPLGFEHDGRENAHIVGRVRRTKPDVVFAAFGAPKQEKWLFRFRHDLGVPVVMGVGSTFDYLAGRLRRAPLCVQRAGLEWAYRLAQEPRRLWRRYLLEDPPFIYYVLRDRWMCKAPAPRGD